MAPFSPSRCRPGKTTDHPDPRYFPREIRKLNTVPARDKASGTSDTENKKSGNGQAKRSGSLAQVVVAE
ncbi:MAG: hypothetical protein ACJ8FY_19390 [Gemmataceae bacterium]